MFFYAAKTLDRVVGVHSQLFYSSNSFTIQFLALHQFWLFSILLFSFLKFFNWLVTTGTSPDSLITFSHDTLLLRITVVPSARENQRPSIPRFPHRFPWFAFVYYILDYISCVNTREETKETFLNDSAFIYVLLTLFLFFVLLRLQVSLALQIPEFTPLL